MLEFELIRIVQHAAVLGVHAVDVTADHALHPGCEAERGIGLAAPARAHDPDQQRDTLADGRLGVENAAGDHQPASRIVVAPGGSGLFSLRRLSSGLAGLYGPRARLPPPSLRGW